LKAGTSELDDELQTQVESVLIEAPVVNAAATGSTNVDVGCFRPQAILHGQNILIHAEDQEHTGITGGEKNLSISYILFKKVY
jgi:pyruvate/2-oxoglutarate dehydrogenase complex dihydrolipoamide dehydrogenase (E3) component